MPENLSYTLTHYLVALAQEYRQRGYDVTYQPFCYAADFLPLGSGAVARQTVTVEHDSDFIWAGNVHTVFTDVAFVANPNILCRLISDTSQRDFQNQQTHILNVFGTGQRPFLWYKPPVFSAKSTWTVELQDLSATIQNVRLTFFGVKAFMTRATQ